jgi:hypothetical protein
MNAPRQWVNTDADEGALCALLARTALLIPPESIDTLWIFPRPSMKMPSAGASPPSISPSLATGKAAPPSTIASTSTPLRRTMP